MSTVHVENTVRDFDSWKANFDKYERFRIEQGVQTYRIIRGIDDPHTVIVDLDFADEGAAKAFLPKLAQIMTSPQAREQLVEHQAPRLYTLVTDRAPTDAAAL